MRIIHAQWNIHQPPSRPTPTPTPTNLAQRTIPPHPRRHIPRHRIRPKRIHVRLQPFRHRGAGSQGLVQAGAGGAGEVWGGDEGFGGVEGFLVVGGEGGAGYAEFADAGGGGVEEGGAGGGGEGGEVAVIGMEVRGELEACLGGLVCVFGGGRWRGTYLYGRSDRGRRCWCSIRIG